MKPWTLYFDGSGNRPDKCATYGWLLYSPKGELIATGQGLYCQGPGHGSSNNTAEFIALIRGLEHILVGNFNLGSLQCYGDSQLVVNMTSGLWGGKKPHLRVLRDRARSLLEQITNQWNLTWIPREKNYKADALSKGVDIAQLKPELSISTSLSEHFFDDASL